MKVIEKERRKFFVTVREVKEDNTLGKSNSFSVKNSEANYEMPEFIELLKETINNTHNGK